MARKEIPEGFTLWVDDWLKSETLDQMTPEQEGAYVRLLIKQWAHETCSLPDSETGLAVMSRLGRRWSTVGSVVRQQFEPHPTLAGRIINRKLWEQRQAKDKWIAEQREKKRKAGLASGEARGRGGHLSVVTGGASTAEHGGNRS